MSDIITAIVDLAKAAPSVSALAGNHGYGDELPANLTKFMPRSAFVIQASGGAPFQPRSKVNGEAQRFDLICYGATPFQADLLRRAVRPVLLAIERMRQGDVLIHWVQPAGGYLTGRDRDGQWPYAFASFQTFFSQEVAP